ncbi:TPA: hypothetical protein LQP13_000380 [Staphylococcus pseudintermedius]|nr:hypothetical protein [Staphylococcus pseudintermedius]
MQWIDKHQKQENGLYSVVIRNIELSNKDLLILDNGLDVEVEVKPIDPYAITDKQRRKIFALCNDIEEYTGQPREYMRYMFMDYVSFVEGYERLSLSNCSRTQAKQVIEVILDWVFYNNVPLNYKTSDLLKNDKAFLYWATVNRNCVICGKSHAELAHYQAVGRGRNRRKIEHTGNKVLALCSHHHREQHNIGIDSFNDKYHLHDSWVDVDERLNKMLKGDKGDE